ncbi:MAG: DUF3786 domain-containing protein [Deltaproteobacteria bacterium]|jgi:hypothetical protein|nr:DUF3786 domain-containing protein [Deltaproteobacteria bacterium]
MRVDDYKNAQVLAIQELKALDPEQVAEKSGAKWANGQFSLPFMNRLALVTAPDYGLTWADQKDGEEFSLTDGVLVLHYLLGAKGLEPQGEMVAYRQIPGGEFYTHAFRRRAEIPLTQVFGHKPGLFTKAAPLMGGELKSGLGDEAAVFRVLPHLDILLLIHHGDEEFDPDGQVLFDKNIVHYLNIEDVAWLGSALVYRLMGLTKGL